MPSYLVFPEITPFFSFKPTYTSLEPIHDFFFVFFQFSNFIFLFFSVFNFLCWLFPFLNFSKKKLDENVPSNQGCKKGSTPVMLDDEWA